MNIRIIGKGVWDWTHSIAEPIISEGLEEITSNKYLKDYDFGCNDHLYLVGLYDQKQLVGVICFSKGVSGEVEYNPDDANCVEICFAYIKKEYRSQGYFLDMFQCMVRYVKKRWNYDIYELYVNIHNQTAIKAYQKHGFEIIRTFISDIDDLEYNLMRKIQK